MKNLLTILFVAIMFVSGMAQESKWPKVDPSNMDMEYYPADVAFRNYLGEDGRNMSPKVRLIYSRPVKKGRTIFGELVPFGKEWRMGANEANEITFFGDVQIGGTTVPSGTYTVFCTPQAKSWDVSFSSQLGIWGEANRDASMTIAKVKVPVQNVESSEELLSMSFREIDNQTANLIVQWDKTRVEVPIKFNPVVFSSVDKSPMDKAHYPGNSAYTNYLEGAEKEITPKVQVTYSRPYKKGRTTFGDMIKEGDIWRIGANQSTEVMFYENVKVGKESLRKGRYAMYAEIKDGSWDIIFSKDIPAWGAANRDESKDVARVNVPVGNDKEVLENVTIIFEEKSDKLVHMVIGWDTTRVELPITFE